MAKKKKKRAIPEVADYSERQIKTLLTRWHKLLAAGRSNEFERVKFVAEVSRAHKNDKDRCSTFLVARLEMHPNSARRYLDLVPLLKHIKAEELWKGLSVSQLKKIDALDTSKRIKLVRKLKSALRTAPVMLNSIWKQLYEAVVPPAPSQQPKKMKRNRVRAHTRGGPTSAKELRDIEYLRLQFAQLANDDPILLKALQGYLDDRTLTILHLPLSKKMKIGA